MSRTSISIRRASVAAFAILSAMLAIIPLRATTATVVPDYIAKALVDPARPAEQVRRDAARKPGELIEFSGVKPGDKVVDFMSGGAYFTRLFSRVVGETGHVYAFLPEEELKSCPSAETAGTRAIEHDHSYANVSVLRAPVNQFHLPEMVDLIWTSQNFHDLYDPFMGPADVPALTKALFDALNPGGVLLVIDHVAAPGSETRDTDTLHRIDPHVIIRRARAAGFVLEAQSDLLRNPDDTHELNVFAPAIRGHTDQIVLKFRKPLLEPGK